MRHLLVIDATRRLTVYVAEELHHGHRMELQGEEGQRL
eukprot:gene31223-32606_t